MEKSQLYLTILDNLTDGVYFVNQSRQIIFWNKAAEQITGYSRAEMEGLHCAESKLEHISQDGVNLCLAGCPLFETLGDGARREHEVLVRHKNGHRFPIIVKVIPIKDDEDPDKIIGAVELFNPASPFVYEASLMENLNIEIGEMESRETFLTRLIKFRLGIYTRFSRKFCVVMAVLDNYEELQKKYGVEQIEEVKKAIINTIHHSMPQGDSFDYWGEDTFVGIFDIDSIAECEQIGNRILMLINRSEVIAGEERILAEASIGVVHVNKNDTVHTLISRSNMYVESGRQRGGNTVVTEP